MVRGAEGVHPADLWGDRGGFLAAGLGGELELLFDGAECSIMRGHLEAERQ